MWLLGLIANFLGLTLLYFFTDIKNIVTERIKSFTDRFQNRSPEKTANCKKHQNMRFLGIASTGDRGMFLQKNLVAKKENKDSLVNILALELYLIAGFFQNSGYQVMGETYQMNALADITLITFQYHFEAVRERKETRCVIYYTGYSDRQGNWVFCDKVVTITEIINLWKQTVTHNAELLIISDCCYSGSWIEQIERYFERLANHDLRVSLITSGGPKEITQIGSFVSSFGKGKKPENQTLQQISFSKEKNKPLQKMISTDALSIFKNCFC